MTAINIFLPYQGDYDWALISGFFARRLLQYNEEISDNCFTKSLQLDGQVMLVSMCHKPQKSGFEISFADTFIASTQKIIVQVSKILDLRTDMNMVNKALQAAGLRSAQINTGLRIPGLSSRFEAGVRAIMGQQVSVTAAVTQLNRLQQGIAGQSPAFITPKQLVQSDLAFLKFPESRKLALKHFAQLMMTEADADFDAWLAIKGIGPWTINYVRLRASNDSDVWLDSDLVIKQRMAVLEQAGQELDHMLASPWRSYLTLSLWNLA